MVIGLMGFEFESPNKGCEALVYSFMSILAKKTKQVETVYNFSNTDLGKIPEYFRGVKFIKVRPRIKDLKFRYIRALRKCDIIFDVTMGDSFSDIYSQKYYNQCIRYKCLAELFCNKYILLPQTYGPFKNKNSEKKAKYVLNRAYKIYCRDELSEKILREEFNIYDSFLVSDMAFVLPYDKNSYNLSSKKKLGINISGLLYKGGFYSENQFNLSLDYKDLIDRLLKTLAEVVEVHLIAHVIDLNENSYDDDYKVCKMLHEKYPTTILAPAFETPIQAKSYISNMNFFIGSRMHSTIASISAGVITIPISYSRKFEGLFGSLDYPYVVNARKENTDSAYELIIGYLRNNKNLEQAQSKSLTLIHKNNLKFEENVGCILNEG